MRVSLSSSYNLLNENEYLSILDKQEDILSLSTYDDYVKNSYIEIDTLDTENNLPTFVDVPLVSNNEKIPIVPKVIKASIEPKVDIPKLHFNKPPILIDQRNKLRTSNSNNEFSNIDYTIHSNRCSRSSFMESPRDFVQQVVPTIHVPHSIPIQRVQQLQQFIPDQRQVFVESPRIQYQYPIQNIYPVQQFQQYNNNYQQYNNNYQQSTQKYVLKSTIVPKDTRTYQNKYYEPSSTYVQECYC